MPEDPETHHPSHPWNGKCAFCGEDELEGGSDGGRCLYCGDITIPPDIPDESQSQ